MPASSSAATIARQAKVFSDSGSCRANGVCPMPTIAVASLRVGPIATSVVGRQWC